MKLSLAAILVAMILASCAGPSTSAVVPSDTSVFVPPTNTVVPTVTPTPAPTQQPTRTPTIGESIVVEQKCMKLEDLPQDLKLPGVLIRNPANPYLENLKDHTKYRIPLDGKGILRNGYGNMAISADGKWLAYIDKYLNSAGTGTDKWVFRMIQASGHSFPLKNWSVNTEQILGWVDNRNIVLEIFSNRTEIIVLNPFTGEMRELPADLIISINNLKLGYYFNPEKAVVIKNGKGKLVDLQAQKDIANFDLGYFSSVAWSPDLLKLAISTDSDRILRIIEGDAEIFSAPIDEVGGIQSKISNLQWSPDGQNLIITTLDKLWMMNLNPQKLIEICITDKNFKYDLLEQPFWSPNGHFFITHGYLGDYNYTDLLVDLEQMRAYRLPIDHFSSDYRIGWLASP